MGAWTSSAMAVRTSRRFEQRCVIADPLVLLEDDHTHQLQVCDILEHLADGLPDNAEAHLASVAQRAISSAWPKHVQFEEEVLFPLLGNHVGREPQIRLTIEQLSREHASDLGSDEELIDVLRELSIGRRPGNPEMVGYMLRGYFGTLRRHVQWENAFLIPLARKTLTEADIQQMRVWIIEYGRGYCPRQASGILASDGEEGSPCACCLEAARQQGD